MAVQFIAEAAGRATAMLRGQAFYSCPHLEFEGYIFPRLPPRFRFAIMQPNVHRVNICWLHREIVLCITLYSTQNLSGSTQGGIALVKAKWKNCQNTWNLPDEQSDSFAVN